MPVARYLLFVGGMLLALLFALDAFTPQQTVVAGNAAPSITKTVVRIRSDQKLPERLVYDTTLPTMSPPAAVTQVAAAPAAPAADVGVQAQVRDTFAQFVRPRPRSLKSSLSRKPREAQDRQDPSGSADARCPATELSIRLFGSNTR